MPSLDETLNNPLVQKVATAAVTKIVGDNATSVATQNLPQANATLNAANAIAGIAQIGTGIATTIAGVRDENQRAKFTQNLQLLTLSQQETLEKALNNANNETQRLQIISMALTDMSKQRINNLQELVAQQEKDRRSQLITGAVELSVFFVVAGVVIYFVSKK